MHLEGRPESSIYWTPQTGAQEIFGAIRVRWAEMGFERSHLGFPTTGELAFGAPGEGGRVSFFEGGALYWWPDTGPIDVGHVVVRYRGLNCFAETDVDQGSSADEPYCVVGVTPVQGPPGALTTPIEEDVDDGDTRPRLIDVYRGPPSGLTLVTTLMEHDFGDPDHYRAAVEAAVKKGADQVAKGVEAAVAGLIGPAVGAVASVAAAGLLTAISPAIVDAVNDLLDTDDDTIGIATTILSAKQMVTLAGAPTQREKNIDFHVATPLLTGEGAAYKGYYDVVRA
jgi:hypothetical protein